MVTWADLELEAEVDGSAKSLQISFQYGLIVWSRRDEREASIDDLYVVFGKWVLGVV